MRERILLCLAHMSGREMFSHEVVALMLCAKL